MTELVHQDISPSFLIDNQRFLPTKVETKFNGFNQADMVDATVVPLEGDVFGMDPAEEPQHNDDFEFFAGERRLFRGFVHDANVNKEGAFKIKALNALHTLKTERVTLSITDTSTLASQIVAEVCEQAGVPYQVELDEVTSSQQQQLFDSTTTDDDFGPIDLTTTIERDETKASKVLDTLANRTNSEWWVDNRNVLRFGLPDSQLHEVSYVKKAEAGMAAPPYRGVKVFGGPVSSQEGKDSQGLITENRMVSKYGMWYDDGQRQTDDYVDPKGNIRITFESTGVILPGMRFGTKDGEEYRATERVNVDMEGMDPEATKTVTVPIEAVGGSLDFNAAPHTITENITGPRQITELTNPNPVKDWKTEAQKEADAEAGWFVKKGVTNTPVFTIKEKEVTTQAELDVIAKNLMLQLKKQAKNGSVTIVGDPEIDPLDVIELPELLGGDRYLVGTVNHTIDSNGFVTKIGCLGLMPGRYNPQLGTGNTADSDS